MPKKKTAFIDKKSAATYHLLYRPSDDGETVGQDARMFVRTDQVRRRRRSHTCRCGGWMAHGGPLRCAHGVYPRTCPF